LPFADDGATVPPVGAEDRDMDGVGERWQDQLYDLLRRHNVTQFAYVPDAGTAS
jgi:hypothetical protein